MKILVVEDDPLIQKAISFRLTKDGHEISIAVDGREALSMLENPIFDIVITDIMMPFNNGIEIINYIKTKISKIMPVLVLSGVGNENLVNEAFALGADDYMTKPFSAIELSARVKRLAKLIEAK